MKNINFPIVITGLFLLLLFLNRCTTQSAEEKAECLKPDSINPNGSSELSVLMRMMHDKAAEMKLLIEQKKTFGNFPEEFDRLNLATPTDSATKKPSFEAFSASYLHSLKTLYQANEATVTLRYNEMVNACLACHSDHCPGPVPKIKKLVIN